MKIKKYALTATETQSNLGRIKGCVTIPQGSRVVHIGAEPPQGEMFVYCEVSPVSLPDITIDISILKVDDTIPTGYKYMGYILAVPILFVYERPQDKIITS